MLKLGKSSNGINIIRIFWILFYVYIFGLLIVNSSSYLDPDFGWHLKVGEEISRTASVPHANIYNYTYTGDWVDHEWLINLITFEIYDNFGYFILTIFFALTIVLTLGLLNIFTNKYFPKTPVWLLASIQLFGLIACLPHFGVRMQEFGLLFLLLELWIIFEFSKNRSWKLLVWLLPLFYLWSNIHGSFLLGLGLLFSWLTVKFIENRLYLGKWKQYFSESQIIKVPHLFLALLFSIGSVLVTFFTPYGLELYAFLGGYSNSFYLTAIQEWIPQYIFPFNYWQLSYLFFLVFVLILYFYNYLSSKNKIIHLWDIFLTVFLLILSFKSRRHFPLIFVATLPFLVKTIYYSFNMERVKFILPTKQLKYLTIFCIFLVCMSQYSKIQIISDPFASYCSKYPCQATSYLINDSKYSDLNILNNYGWGGFLIWVYPEKKLFIDGRIPQAEYAGHTFLEEYYEFFYETADFESKLNQYNIKLVLTSSKDDVIAVKKWEQIIFSINKKELITTNYLRRYLDDSKNWEKIYSDPLASIYLKKE